MLKHTIRESARRAIEARFKLRDEVLIKELDQLAAVAGSQASEEELSKLSVRLRVVCEQDLFERAFIVWNNLKRAHEEHGAKKTATLIADLLDESQAHMQRASLNLATHLRQVADALAPAFGGRQGLNADWLSALRNRAVEKYSKDMEDYARSLHWGIKSLVESMRGQAD